MQLKTLPAKQLVPGIIGYYAHGNNTSIGLVEIEANTSMAMHEHVHEQITYLLEGKLEMVIDGKQVPLEAGMVAIIPSNTPHAAYAPVACKLIDVFNPVREEYRQV